MREVARSNGTSLWQAAYYIIEHKQLASRALNSLQHFVQLIEQLTQSIQSLPLHEKIEHVIHDSGLIDHYKKEKGERGRARLENLDELINAGRNYDETEYEVDAEQTDALTAFLSHASLEAGERQGGESDDCIQMMTLHSAKGLEFKQVFLCGMEEGIFPHKFSMDDSSRLEEERRLCYVGMTRAMQKLVLCRKTPLVWRRKICPPFPVY